ncbi:AAA family ATPase [Elizabethkingia anophelis]|uniref:AAA family ATPase n=1 Tax=Elizabethkingia anophelis TaxID=1117645 RepID=UPI000C9CEEA0|nr:AAA family ATPase [Elizabethkingia anophelis]MCT3758334.1 AAA family ATPase [Elizabethkingia anophelis]MCT3972018.1 AAA family ATPase [Elizabethkingia anophelis]MCT4000495.1 AAA family ATPase [Elizabethkingia anophelis]MCT4014524.1 AAA family ATPase [Elizabethkingia anophelis]MCT4018085.1 AAA family ATPase [Elizabethkingia anophelis]
MKEYPRIRRLSALGIVHHQNFDYEFSPFRTDFVGEGGAGKSMISDLLQLICVGTRAFHSPTKGTGPRKPNTMVLRTEGKGTDMGYAFINIEKAENQYIVMGIYLESSNTSNMFIIQDGNNFDTDTQLIPFSKLLGVEDFQKNNTIFPINELKEHIQDSLNLTCESWERTPNYHRILFNNKILPIDLSLDNKTLENYAKIIQAFSRESLDISKTHSLQSFLFGDHKEQELIKKFYDTVEELQEDTKQFENNLEEIEALTTKQNQLSKLLDLKTTKENTYTLYLKSSYKYFTNQISVNSDKLKIQLNEYYFSLQSLPSLKENVSQKITWTQTELETIEPLWEEAFKIKNDIESKISHKEKFSSWMRAFNCSGEELIEKFNKYHKSKDTINKIKELEEILASRSIRTAFKSNEYEEKNIVNQIEKQIERLETDLELKNKLKALNNIDDKNSLVNWALQLPNELTLNQEAVIRKYQNEGIKAEIPVDISKRYIPTPEILMDNIVEYKSDDKGLWLNFNGVIEFFSTDFSPIFNTQDKNKIKEYFEKETTSILNNISNLEKEINEKKILKDVFENLENPDEYLNAWNTQTDLVEQLETHEMYEMDQDKFREYFNIYSQDSIENDFKQSREAYSELNTNRSKLITLKANLTRDFENLFEPKTNHEIENIKNRHNFSFEENFEKDSFLSSLKNTEDYYTEFRKVYIQEKSKYGTTGDIIQLDEKITELLSKKNEIYVQNTEIIKNISDSEELNTQIIEELKENYDFANNAYHVEYKLIIRQYLKNNVSRFENTGDFQSLCEEILPPEILNDINILEKEVIEKIGKYLKDINLKNKRLNNRKLQKLAAIVEEVSNEVSEQRNNIRLINNFLNSDDKEITGGHLVSIEDSNQDSFSSGWMDTFTDNITKDFELGLNDSLFESEKGISNDLERFPSLKEKLLQAFYRSGGSRNLKPKIEELLNPKSYYNVKFSIKTSQGKKNDGSTSQAYAAISLLCIAKLSLLNKQSKNKFVEAIRFMAIDEAEGLGSNFDMLYNIARANDYQLLSLSINPNKIDIEGQNIYLLHNSKEDEKVNYTPIPIFGSMN